MGVGFKIKQLRLAKGMSQRELARKSGLSQPSLSYIEEKDPQTTKALPAIAKALEVEPAELLIPVNPDPGGITNHETVLVGSPTKNVQFVEIPEYDIAFSAGNGCYTAEVVPDSRPKVYSLSFFQNRHINPEKCKRYKVSGDSMEPLLYDGDSVLAYEEPVGTKIRDGYVYVVRYGSELRIKRLTHNLDGSVTLRSVNPAHKDFTIPAQDVCDQFAILGRVIDKSGSGGLGG